MQVSFTSLRFAIALAIFLVYLVMAPPSRASCTRSSCCSPFRWPWSGVVRGLLATGTTITVIVLIGTIMLVGIVVNNAIVLIDTDQPAAPRRGWPSARRWSAAGHAAPAPDPDDDR